MGMPRYFFHIRDGENIIPDEEGLELPDNEAAGVEARRSAVEMLADAQRDSTDISHQVIEVTTADGVVIARVELAPSDPPSQARPG